MGKALEMGKTSATGSFYLLLGVATSTVVMAVGTILLTRLLSPAEYGLYTIAMTPSLTINLFRDWGVNSAITKHIAGFRARDKDGEIRSVIVAGLAFEVMTGFALSIVSLLLASFIASAVFHRPESSYAISIMSVTIFSGALLTVAQSSFIGFERMKLNSLTVVCQSIVKTVTGPVLVIAGYGVLGAVIGYTTSFLAAGIIGLAILYIFLFRPLRKSKIGRSEISKTLKAMLKFGVPISISTILAGSFAQFYAFMMPIHASDTMVGNYQVAANFSILLSFVTVPISTVLFPAFAKLDPKNDHQLLRTVFASSIKYTALLLVPATMASMALASPMINTLFGEKYAYAPFFLVLYVIFNLFALIGNLSLPSFLSGLGDTKMLMKQSIVTLSVGIPLAFLLIPSFGVVGVIMTSLFAGMPGMFWSLYWAWNRYGAKADFESSMRILASSSLAAVAAYLSVNFISVVDWLKLAIGVLVFLMVYVLSAPLIKAVVLADIENLRAMTSGLGIVSRIVNVPLVVAEKVFRRCYGQKRGNSSASKLQEKRQKSA